MKILGINFYWKNGSYFLGERTITIYLIPISLYYSFRALHTKLKCFFMYLSEGRLYIPEGKIGDCVVYYNFFDYFKIGIKRKKEFKRSLMIKGSYLY